MQWLVEIKQETMCFFSFSQQPLMVYCSPSGEQTAYEMTGDGVLTERTMDAKTRLMVKYHSEKETEYFRILENMPAGVDTSMYLDSKMSIWEAKFMTENVM